MIARIVCFLGVALLCFNSTAFAQPVNDDCTNPFPLPFGALGIINTNGATASAANLNGCPNFVEDVWFSVTPMSNGLLDVSHSFNPDQHAVYLSPGPGICPTDADQIYCDSPSNQNGSLTPAVAGETYLIRVGSFQGNPASSGNFLEVNLLAPPANDDCDAPQVIASLPATVSYDTDGANTSSGFSCTPNMRDLWFEVTASMTGLMAVDANAGGGAFGVDVAAYARLVAGACPVDADELACPGTTSLSFPVTAGESYLLRVGAPFGGFLSGDLSITEVLAPPTNDDCTAPIAMALPSSLPFDTAGATPDATGLSCNQNDDIWFSVVPPGDGQVRVVLTGNFSLNHKLYGVVSAGTCPTDADSISNCWSTDDTYTTVTGGQTVLIRVGQSNAGPISGNIAVEWVPHPANDDCSTPTPIAIPSTGVAISTVGATPTPGVGACTNHGDAWYSFTAPSTGTMFLNFGTGLTRGLFLDTGVGCPVSGPLECGGGSFAYWDVVGGESYFLWISFLNQFPPVDTTLDIQMLVPAPNDDCAPGGPTVVTVPTAAPVAWDNTGGLDDTNGLSCGIDKDLWYTFSAPFTGNVRMTQSTLELFAVYHDASAGTACPTNSDQLVCSTFPNTSFIADFTVQAGESYFLRFGGFNQTPQSGSFELEYILGDPENVMCDSSVPNQITASYTVPVGSNYDLGVDVSVNGVFVTNIPQTQLSYVESLAPAFTGVVKIGFTGLSSTLGSTSKSECAVAVGGVAYDDCANALPILAGDTVFDNTISILEPTAPLSSCSQNNPDRDVWFSFTSPSTELFTAATCTTPWLHSMEVYLANPGCPGPMDAALDCASSTECDISFFASVGETYLIRVTGIDTGFGAGTLSLVEDCSALTGLVADYDCTTGSVTLDWNGGLHVSYDIVSDLGVVAAGLATAGFTIPNETPGFRNYFVTGSCPNGASLSASVDVYVADLVSPGQDLILALEGLEDGGNFGNIDSVGALQESLTLGLGRTVSVLAFREFDQFPCLSTLTDAAEVIWVMAGTAPRGYGLSVVERDLLASLAASGKAIYLEAADLWSFAPPSLLDLRDGIEPDSPGNNIPAGDDSLTSLDGAFSGITGGDFTGFSAIAYTQDAVGNDGNDQLVVSGTDMTGTYPPDPDITAGAIWFNEDDTMTGETIFVAGVHAVHNIDEGRMISCSFEFGGFTGNRDALAQAYVNALAPGLPPIGEEFVRGDTNADNSNNIADAVYLLGNLFPIGAPNVLQCLEAADANNDGSINIADAVAILGSLFGNPAAPLAAPYPNCGTEADSPNQTGIGCVTGTCP